MVRGAVVKLNFAAAPATCDSAPKLVASFVMPLMAAVPAFADVRRMFPLEGKALPSVARTWMPLMVSASTFAVPLTESVTVMVVLDTAIEAAVMSLPEVNETLPAPELKFQPLGAVRMSVLL